MGIAAYYARVAGKISEVYATVMSGGAANAGAIVALHSDGKLHPSVLPTGVGADTHVANAGEDLQAGDFVYVSAAGTFLLSTASVVGKTAQRFVKENVTSGQPATGYRGSNDALTGLSPGERYYLSDSAPGGITLTPVARGAVPKVHQFVGVADSATKLNFEADDVIVLAVAE